MSISKFIIIFSITCLFSSCKKENQEFTDTPIIEAYLETGKLLKVKITRQIPFSSDVVYSTDDIDHLDLSVTFNNTVRTLTALGNGEYIDSSTIVSNNTNYDLSFMYNKKTVSAYTFIPTKPQNLTQSATTYTITRLVVGSGPPTGGFTMPDPVKITWSNTDNSYYLVIVENIEATLDPIRDFGTNTPPGNRFKKTPTTAADLEINSQEFQYYGTHRIIIYHVLPDYATLYESSSSSSQNLSNPSTSIVNGYGIFTGLDSDTLFLDVEEP